MAGFIASWQRPDSAILGLVGDFDTRSMMQTIKQVSVSENTPAPSLL